MCQPSFYKSDYISLYLLLYFVYSSASEHVSCFHLQVLVNNSVINIGVYISVWIPVFKSFERIVRSGVPGFSLAQSLSCVQLFATLWTIAYQASLSITNSQSLLTLMSIESVMPSNHLILWRPLLLPPSIFHSIRAFSNESVLCIRWPKYWSFNFNISPSN